MSNNHKVLEKLCMFFGSGKVAAASIVSATIALSKAICRPIFTMADKKEKPETKKYTAIREGLTELIAIPVYLLSGVAAGKLTKRYSNPKYFVKMAKKQLGGANVAPEAVEKKAAELAKEMTSKLGANLAFLGVAVSALFVIPAICSIAIKPLMGVIYKNNPSEDKSIKEDTGKSPVFKGNLVYNQPKPCRLRVVNPNNYYAAKPGTMKVGGV